MLAPCSIAIYMNLGSPMDVIVNTLEFHFVVCYFLVEGGITVTQQDVKDDWETQQWVHT